MRLNCEIMKKIFLPALLAIISVTAVSAQRIRQGADFENLRGPFITNSLGENWFISAGAGINTWYRPSLTGGETFRGFDRVKPVYQLSVGKWVHPYWGFRLQGNYGSIKANTSLHGMYTRDFDPVDPSGKYTLKFDYWTLEGAVLFNFSNAVGGYKAARFYNAILFAGTGFMHSFGRDAFDNRHTSNNMAFNFGLLNTLRLARCLDFYAELKANVVRQDFTAATVVFDNPPSHYTGARGWGILPSATFGFIFKLNNHSFIPAKTAMINAVSDAVRPYSGRIGALEDELAAAQERAASAQARADAALERASTAEATPERVVVETVTESVVEHVPLAIFFRIGDATLNEFEMLNIRFAADVIKNSPGRTFTLTGMADRETGTPSFNQRLSEMRVEVVRKALIGFGVNPDQLQNNAVGDRINRFVPTEMNRVVIIK